MPQPHDPCARPAGDRLRALSAERAAPGAIPCILLVHNEANLLPALLDHYRGLGAVAFVAVDDRSDDGSREILAAAPDVTLYEPAPGSTYDRDKRQWRRDLLDAWADGGWCLVPDADEHLVWRGGMAGGLPALTRALEREGADALMAVMIDMYADAPLGEQHFTGGPAAALASAFPFFDGPAPAPFGYRLLPPATRFLRRYPTPPVMVWGGLRERLFFGAGASASPAQRRLLSAFAHMGRPLNPGPLERAQNALTRRAVRGLFSADPFTVTKLPLLRWHRGLGFSGGPHAVTAPLALSERIAGLLHYKFTRGAAGIAYTAQRGQHAGGAQFYRRMMDGDTALAKTPVGVVTRRYAGPDSLSGILRDAPFRRPPDAPR